MKNNKKIDASMHVEITKNQGIDQTIKKSDDGIK